MYTDVLGYVFSFIIPKKYAILFYDDEHALLLSVLLSFIHNMDRRLPEAKSSEERQMTHCPLASLLIFLVALPNYKQLRGLEEVGSCGIHFKHFFPIDDVLTS
jgi:hypothetical protein